MKMTPMAASLVLAKLSLFSFAIAPLTVQAATFVIDSRVTQVLVYPDQAWIQRQAKIDLPAGTHELRFHHLSQQSNMQSASFAAHGASSLQILKQEIESVPSTRFASPQLASLKQQLDEQQALLDKLNDELSVIEHQQGLLRSLQEGVSQANQVMSVQELEQMQTYMRSNYTQLNQEARGIKQAIEQQNEKLRDAQEDYDAAYGQQGDTSYVYRVTVHADKAGPQTLDLSYYSWAASWVPAYQLQYDTKTQTLSFDYSARVNQHTAEDWQDIAISLSTGRPMQVGVVPELDPQYVRFRPDPNMIRQRGPMAAAPMAMQAEAVGMATDAAAERTVKSSKPQAQVQTGMVASTFAIAGTVSIPSGSQQHNVHISSSEQQVKPEYAYYPGFWSDKVLVTVEGKNTLDYPLLPGSLLSFTDGKLVGSGELEMLMPGQAFKQMLGEDQTIIAKREPSKRFEENNGLINKTKVVRVERSYRLSNQRQEPVAITVYDVMPSSQHKDIGIKILEPKNIQVDQYGRYQQTIQLKGAEQQLLKQSYTIEYPGDKEIIGGE